MGTEPAKGDDTYMNLKDKVGIYNVSSVSLSYRMSLLTTGTGLGGW